MFVLGIDPGVNGGIAVSNYKQTFVHKMPEQDALVPFFRQFTDCIAFIEINHGHVPGTAASSMRKLHTQIGVIQGTLLAVDCIVRPVSPKEWMPWYLPIGTVPKEKQQRKNAIKAISQEKNPHIKVTLWNADALGILDYGLAQIAEEE